MAGKGVICASLGLLESLVMNLLAAPGGKELSNERGYVFGKEYRDYVEKVIMTKKPHPEARPFGAFKIG